MEAAAGAGLPAGQVHLTGRVAGGLAALWCLAFPLVGVTARLHWFADGSLFSYAVAAGDAWAFHWRQIGGRVAAFALASLPAEAFGGVAGPAAGVALYGVLLFAMPGLGLAACWAADGTRVIRVWAAVATAVLCPVVFGFPTELWFAHAAAWPALALLWRPVGWRWPAGMAALGVVVLSHEAGVIWAGVLVAALRFSPGWRVALPRAAGGLVALLLAWAACRWAFRPDPYVAEVLGRNAWNLFAPASLSAPLVLTLAGGLALYAAALPVGAGPAAAVAACGLAVWWLGFDAGLHAWDRYYLRTLLLGAVPALLAGAAWQAGGGRLRVGLRAGLGALAVVTLVHVVETAKFVVAWRGYVAAVRVLADGEARDPALGDADFVSAARVPARFAALSWHSTTPFLSVLASDGYAPGRLVVDPRAGYFWFGCAAATANAAAARGLPPATRAMVRRYACLHRAGG